MVERIHLFSFIVGRCSTHSGHFALMISLAFNFYFCLHHSFKKIANSIKIVKEQNYINWNASAVAMLPVIPDQCPDKILRRF